MSAKAKQAKQAREGWETKLIACKETLMQVSQATQVVKRSVTKKLAELNTIWAKLQISRKCLLQTCRGRVGVFREQRVLERSWQAER